MPLNIQQQVNSHCASHPNTGFASLTSLRRWRTCGLCHLGCQRAIQHTSACYTPSAPSFHPTRRHLEHHRNCTGGLSHAVERMGSQLDSASSGLSGALRALCYAVRCRSRRQPTAAKKQRQRPSNKHVQLGAQKSGAPNTQKQGARRVPSTTKQLLAGARWRLSRLCSSAMASPRAHARASICC